MAKLQKYFETFHDEIRADYDLKSELREKRDRILKRLRENLPDGYSFEQLLQGSYAMNTGVMPIGDKEPDIDVGLRFNFTETEKTATEVRDAVLAAVKEHTADVKPKGPCVRVTYAAGYHVDLVSYARRKDANEKSSYHLAHRDNGWRPADPPALLQYVRSAADRFEATKDSKAQTDQLRRVIRYLKRWDDVAISDEGPGKPSGLAYTLYAIKQLTSPAVDLEGKSDDLRALLTIARAAGASVRLSAVKPTPEYEDLFAGMPDEDMAALIKRFAELRDLLIDVSPMLDERAACEKLRAVFGVDFPVPALEDVSKRSAAPAVVPSARSA